MLFVGQLWATGRNTEGQLGQDCSVFGHNSQLEFACKGRKGGLLRPIKLGTARTKITHVSASGGASLAKAADGTIFYIHSNNAPEYRLTIPKVD